MKKASDNTTFGSIEPRDIETEQALLGAILLDSRQIDTVRAVLKWHHFSEPLHQRIYDAMLRIHKTGKPVSPLSLKEFAQSDEPMRAVGGPDYLNQLIRMTPSATAAPEFAAAIFDMAKRRDIIEIADRLRHDALTLPADENPADLINTVSSTLTGLGLRTGSQEPVSGQAAAEMALDRAWKASQGGVPPGLSLGFADLDRTLGGAQPGDMIVLAGRPGMGKSAMAGALALNVARSGNGVLYISCEMTAEQLGRRFVSDLTRSDGHHLPYQDLRAGKIDMLQYDLGRAALQHIDKLPLIIDDRRNPAMEQVTASAKMAAVRFKKSHQKLGLIVIDHIQLIASPQDYRGNRVSEMTDISKTIKQIGRDLGVPIIALSQLNRDLEGRQNKDKRPKLRDLRESGAIEQDADIVLMLYREEYYVLQDKPDISNAEQFADWERIFEKCKNQLDVIIAKNREGDQITVKLHCEMKYSAIRDWKGFR